MTESRAAYLRYRRHVLSATTCRCVTGYLCEVGRQLDGEAAAADWRREEGRG